MRLDKLKTLKFGDLLLLDTYNKDVVRARFITSEINRRLDDIFEVVEFYQFRYKPDVAAGEVGWRWCSFEEYDKYEDMDDHEVRIVKE